MIKLKRAGALTAAGALAAGALVFGTAGPAQAVGCGKDTITLTGGEVIYNWSCSSGKADIKIKDTKADGKCAWAHVWSDPSGASKYDTWKKACGSGTGNRMNTPSLSTLHIELFVSRGHPI
ncbi:hypothetical protein ABZ820_12530 [Streptomyces diacarni]|uniref:hypothetical protein n=1 Tax=Streptomyces diacarni TaxID=2800381 RepID=UPI0033F84B47